MPSEPFATLPAVAEPQRLALTPKLDGKLDPEEWDELSSAGGCVAYFQWEPEKLHAAARVPSGKELVLSLDLRGNGWLVGSDNVEVRVKWAGDRPECKARTLDATAVSGPVWVDAPMFQESLSCAAVSGAEDWTVELTLADPGIRWIPETAGTRIGARLDAVGPEEGLEPFLPRACAALTCVFERGSNVPGGLRWKPEIVSRAVAPGSKYRIRMTFNGANDLGLAKAEMRTEGLAKEDTAEIAQPFPSFDKKGRAFVDYNTTIASQALDGFRVMRTTVTDAQGGVAVLRTSYAIAPLVVFDVATPGKLKASDKDQKVKCSAYARSNTTHKVDGELRISPPEGWKVISGDGKGFIIANAYGSVRRVFELLVPANTKGTFPVRLQADLGGKAFAQTAWITIS